MLGKESCPPPPVDDLHGSFLPKYRGRAPVNWVLVNGETETGVTLHVMTEARRGDIVAQEVPVAFEDTALTLYGKLEKAGRSQVLPVIASGEIPRRCNEIEKGSYYGGRKPEDGPIDWTRSAVEIYNLVRAVTRPFPGAFSSLFGAKCFIWRAKPVSPEGFAGAPAPGQMVVVGGPSFGMAGGCPMPPRKEKRILVGTGSGLLLLEAV